ncbi:MAG: hypothetical protein ACTS8R_08830 [Arsenophonus sp. NC-QC1-MAG3]
MANVKIIIDVRDENLVLTNKEMTNVLLVKLVYEEFNEINEQLINMMEQVLFDYKKNQNLLDTGLILHNFFTKIYRNRIFILRMIVNQAPKLGYKK